MSSKKSITVFAISGISLLSIIFFSSSFFIGISDVSADSHTITVVQRLTFSDVSADFDAWKTGTGSTDPADKISAITDFDGPGIHDGDASYITSIVNNDIQGFVNGTVFDRIESINYINVTSIAHKMDDARKATKFSQGVAMGGVPIALPNGGVELQSGYTQFTQIFDKNPFSAKNQKHQVPWVSSDLANLEYIMEQNTDTKEVRVTEFIVEISMEVAPPTITITDSPASIPWGHDATVSGDTTGIAAGDTIEILWGDGTSDTFAATANWSKTHYYSMNTVSSTETKTVTATLTAGSQTPSDTVDIDVLAHDTSLDSPTVPDDVKWSHTFQVTDHTLDDLNAALCTGTVSCPAAIPSKTITYSGSAVLSPTDGTSTVTSLDIVSVGMGNTGVQTVLADFVGDAAYNSSPQASSSITILAHDTSLDAPTLSHTTIPWGDTFQVTSNILNDLDTAGCTVPANCPDPIEGKTLTYSGSAVGSADDGTSTVGTPVEITASQDTGSGKTVIADFAGDADYNSLTSGSSLIEIELHDTAIEDFVTAGELVSTDTPFSVMGTLIDEDRNNLGVNNKIITLTLSDSSTMPSATTGGATIDSSSSTNGSDLDVVACGFCSTGSGPNVVLLEEGDKIIFDVPVTWATLYFEDPGVKTLNSGALGLPEIIVFHDGNVDAGFYVVYGPGVSEISINSITGDGTDIGLTRITASNEEANINIIDEDVTLLSLQTSPTIDISGGSFSSIGDAPSVPGLYDVTAEFAGDGLYKDSSATDSFNLEANQGSESGLGGQINVVADAGTGYTGILCGADGDNDSICAGWEGVSGKTFGVSGLTYHLALPDRSDSQKNLYVEIDYMTDHEPKAQAIQDIIDVFADNDITVTVFVDEVITHVEIMNIWTDSDDIATNDFDSIKANYYGSEDERSSATGQVTNIASVSPTAKTLTITGITVSTPEHSPRVTKHASADDHLTQGTILIKSKITTSNSVTLGVTATVDKPILTGAGLDIFSRPSASVLPIPGTEHVVTVSVPFKTTGALTDVSLGTLTVPFTISGAGATATAETNPNSPHASSTLTEAYAQLVRYVIFGHSQGGPSGTAEFLGNDAVVTLGDGFGGTAPNHSGSVGTIKEQAGTLMHEFGHWLGLKHGGPEKIGGVVVTDADVNCNPVNTGVMPYSRQTNAYLGALWTPDYSHGNLDSITESALDEEKGFFSSSSDTTYHVFVNGNGFVGKPNSYTTGDPIRAVNFNANGVIDTADVQVDLNNFGIDGCNTSDDTQTFNDYDEWFNLNFNWKDTVSGQFDGGNPNHPTPNGDLNADNNQLQKLQGLQFFGAIPPPSSDGTEIRKAGSTLPLKMPVLDSDGNPIDFATVTATYLTNATGPLTGDIEDSSGNNLFTYDINGEFYILNWKTPKKAGTYWITAFVDNPTDVGPDKWPLIDFTNDPVLTDENGDEITVQVILVKGPK